MLVEITLAGCDDNSRKRFDIRYSEYLTLTDIAAAFQSDHMNVDGCLPGMTVEKTDQCVYVTEHHMDTVIAALDGTEYAHSLWDSNTSCASYFFSELTTVQRLRALNNGAVDTSQDALVEASEYEA